MGRKLILTAFLAVLYHGDPPQLGGSLLTIFLFLLLHLLNRPYLNQGLNVFQVKHSCFLLCSRNYP